MVAIATYTWEGAETKALYIRGYLYLLTWLLIHLLYHINYIIYSIITIVIGMVIWFVFLWKRCILFKIILNCVHFERLFTFSDALAWNTAVAVVQSTLSRWITLSCYSPWLTLDILAQATVGSLALIGRNLPVTWRHHCLNARLNILFIIFHCFRH